MPGAGRVLDSRPAGIAQAYRQPQQGPRAQQSKPLTGCSVAQPPRIAARGGLPQATGARPRIRLRMDVIRVAFSTLPSMSAARGAHGAFPLNARAALLPCLLALQLSACSNASESVDSVPPTTEVTPSTEATPPAAVAPGLIKDPEFAVAGVEQALKHWQLRQHAGDASYSLEVKEGWVVLKRIGVEPWGSIGQTFEVAELAGKTLEWSAELTGEIGEARGEAFDATGLSVEVSGFAPGDLPMMGARTLLALSTEPPMQAGPVTQQRYSLRFQIPQGTDQRLKVAVQLTRDGELRMRAPSLQVIEEAPSQ